MSTYTIGEVADRSGFSASALRYYEGIGLVVPAARNDAGYRLYDEHALARLGFIARAKQLGCSLEEITDLFGIWDGGPCAAVQHRFHQLVSDKISSAQHHISELTAFTAQLQQAARLLGGQPVEGRCNDDCACMLADPGPSRRRSSQAVVTGGVWSDSASITCTLEPDAMSDRLGEWQVILNRARARTATVDGALRIDFDRDVALDELARLVAAEQDCCAFFSFTIVVDGHGIALEVRAPEGAVDIVSSLFGEPA